MPAIVSQVTRVITITARALGIDQTTSSMNALADAEANVAVSQDTVSKSTLSMQSRLNGLQRQLDVNYKSQQSLASATKTLSGARAQGLIDAAEESRLLDLAKTKYAGLTPEIIKTTGALSLNRVQMLELTHVGRELATMFAMGVDPMRAFTLESGRIATFFTSGDGGITGTFTRLLPILAPIAAGIAAIGVALGAFTQKLNQGKPVALSFFDVLKGIAVTAWDAVKEQFDAAPEWMSTAWDRLGSLTSDAINNIIQQFAILAAQVNESFQELPDDVMLGIQDAANTAISWLNNLTDGVNAFARSLSALRGDSVAEPTAEQIAKTHVPALNFAGTSDGDIAKMRDDLNKRVAQIMGTNYLPLIYKNGLPSNDNAKGGKSDPYKTAITDVEDQTRALQAQQAAIGLNTYQATKLEEITKLQNAAMKDATGLTPARVAAIDKEADAYARAKANLETLNEVYNDGKEAFTGFFTSLSSDLEQGQGFWQSFADAAIKAIDDILQKAIEAAANQAFEQLWTGGSSSGGGGIGGWIAGLLGIGGSAGGALGELGGFGSSYANGGVQYGSGISAYSSSIVDKPTLFPFASGIGLMGEAGAEAIMPLRRGSDGRLGVSAANGNSGGSVNVHVTTEVINGNLVPTMVTVSGQVAGQQIESYDHALPKRLQQIQKDPRAA